MNRFNFGERRVTWIELFFDLVFVAAAHEIATLMYEANSFLGVMGAVFLFVLLLWTWLSHTLYTSRFETGHSLFYVMFTMLTMAAVFAMTVQMKGAFGVYMVGFAFAYAATRFIIVLMYALSFVGHPHKALYLFPVWTGYLASGVLWVLSVFTPFPYVLWGIAVVIDIAMPLLARKVSDKVSVHSVHFPERLGLLTVIMLGEMIISMVISMHTLDLSRYVISLAISGLLVISVIFWVYFRFIEHGIVAKQHGSAHLYIYSHLPLFAGLVFLASGYKSIFFGTGQAWFVIIGIVLFALSFRAIKYLRDERIQRRQLTLLFGLLFPALIIYYFATTPLILNTIVLSIIFALYLTLSELFSAFGVGARR